MTHPPSCVLMLGATGTAGRATAVALRDAGHMVVAFGRGDPAIKGVTVATGNVTDTASIKEVFARIRPGAVVSCLASRTGAPADAWRIDHAAHLDLLDAALAVGCRQFVVTSAICVQKPVLAFQHAKLAFEQALIASGITYSIVRPTALFKSLSGQLARVQAGKPYLVFGDGTLTACKPISDSDLGQFTASCLRDPSRQNAVLPIGGPGPALTPRAMGDALFRLTGHPPKFKSVPLGFLDLITRSLSVGGALSSKLRAKSELARIGRYYASESMLLWDGARYDADATPEYGEDTLFGYYQDLIDGNVILDRGDHAVF